MKKKIFYYCLLLGVICGGVCAYAFFAPMNRTDEVAYLCIDNDDTMDSVNVKLDCFSGSLEHVAFKTLASMTGYGHQKLRTGRFELDKSMGALQFFRHVRNCQQAPVRLTVPSVRTMNDLASFLSEKLMMNKKDLMAIFENNDSCMKYGKDTATIACLFIPDTYEIYWNIGIDKFMKKMQKGSEHFWNADRMQKADALGLTPNQVITIASIIDEETANNAEKPMIAGMYYNRYKQGMPLQADPTIKYALKKFELKRIYENMLNVKSPYNTYRNIGLPPGPIRIPSVAGIDATLNLVHHEYMYMCAKEDFSGTHNFARTYAEHLQNAKKYSDALNARGIQ